METRMPGIAEFRGLGTEKLIIAELPDGHVMLTQVDMISGERFSITLPRHEAYVASFTLRNMARSLR